MQQRTIKDKCKKEEEKKNMEEDKNIYSRIELGKIEGNDNN
jgi:hypothetical protein